MTRATSRILRALALAAFVLLAACGDGAGKRGIALSECRLPRFAQPGQCATLEVPEDRTKPDGRKVNLFIAVLPANTLSPKPDPLFILAGGPGQAASQLAPFASQLNAIRRTRDIVLIDQRGTGRSSPLECFAFEQTRQDPYETDPLPRARLCADQLRINGVDASQYTTTTWIADIDAVRAALGYPRLNLWGGSYGSRAALEYLRRHPDRVRSLVLDGVVPPQMKVSLDVWPTRDAALTDVVDACRKSAKCIAAHPDPAATLAAIAGDLGPDGKIITLQDPRTGETMQVPIAFDLVMGALQPLTYIPELSGLIPELLDRAKAGDYAPLIAAVDVVTGNLSEQMSAALHYSVTCAEDVPRITADDRKELAGVRAESLANKVLDVCTIWPRGSMPADFAEPVKSDVPVLMLSGALDPVTPPRYADEVAKTLPNSKRVVAGGLGHIVSSHGCAPRLIASFVEKAGLDD
ncbi:MAG TPA: alpha/beta hydrolase, partial [Casimicrobiaceae bacterium]|nr:alpha/beta hydrolase [Casimicrobiaceae bacterium]